MTWIPLPCGIHEAARELDACPVCARAMAKTERELAKVEIIEWTRAAHRKRIERNQQAQEEAMADSKYTDAQKAEALARLAGGESAKTIANGLGCSDGLIYLWRQQARTAVTGSKPEKVKPAKAAKPTKAPKKAPSRANHPDAVSLDDDSTDVAPYTVADPSKFAHEDVIAFLAKLPPLPWCLGDAIRLLAFHAIDRDRDDVHQARERIDAHLRAIGEAA